MKFQGRKLPHHPQLTSGCPPFCFTLGAEGAACGAGDVPMPKTLKYTLEDERLEPTNHPFLNSENHLPNPNDYVPCLIFRGVRFIIIQRGEPPFWFLMVVDFQGKIKVFFVVI